MKNRRLNTGITRSEFCRLKIPVLPYCEIRRGCSTTYNESFHIENKNTNCQLNFFWRLDNTVSIGFCDANIKDVRQRNKKVLERSETFNNEVLIKFCNDFLK